MEILKQLTWEYRYILIILFVVILICIFEWEKTKTIAYGLMLQAKSMAKDAVLKSGTQQEEWVVKKTYQFLPKSLNLFISEERRRKVIHYLYVKSKDYIDDGKINNSIH